MKWIVRGFMLPLMIGSLGITAFTACGQSSQPRDGSASFASDSTRDGRIIGGFEVNGDEAFAKTVVSLVNVRQGSLCTASIYSDSLLVTAAHCVHGAIAKDLRIVYGKNLSSHDLTVRAADAYVVSPTWKLRSRADTNTGDVALVHFRGGLAEGYSPAKLLLDAALLKNDQPVVLAGYGYSDGTKKTGDGLLRFVETKILNASFSSTEILVDQTHGKGACHGDSGGPAYITVNGELQLWGITSRGVNDTHDDCSTSAAYTRIPSYADWIVRTAKSLEAGPRPGL